MGEGPARCADLRNSSQDCGECGRACSGLQACSEGRCLCPEAMPDECERGGCTNLAGDPGHCGSCDVACPAEQRCELGRCVCPEARPDRCFDRCVDLSRDRANCGTCGRACEAGFLCESGECVLDCASTQTACPANAPTHCADLLSDEGDCGACGSSCAGLERCERGHCVCPPLLPDSCGFGNCTALASDPKNCGECGAACSGIERCEGGHCACPPELPDSCGPGSCTDLGADRANCGECGQACDAGFTCSSGHCVPDCRDGQMACPVGAPSLCADLQTDSANCGACGVQCSGLTRCVQGSCACPPEFPDECAPGACTDVESDDEHCGACGQRCPVGRGCRSGTCQCVAPLLECGGLCVDPRTDSNHCGSCTSACPALASCSGGVCTARCTGMLGFPGVPNLPQATRYGLYNGTEQAVATDLDGDGVTDLLVPQGSDRSTVVYGGNGDGTMSVRQLLTEWYQDLRPIDFNSDGTVDGVYGASVNGLCYLTNQGGTLGSTGCVNFADCRSMAIADFDGNGSIDIACPSHVYQPSAFVLTGPTTAVGVQGQCETLVSGDFDGDGDEDIACAGTTTQRLLLFFNDGAANFTAGPENDVGAKPAVSAAADLDGDGQLDLLGFVQAPGSSDDELVLLHNAGAGTFVPEVLGKVGRCQPHLVDMDLDGRRDIVVCQDVFYSAGAGHFVRAGSSLPESAVEVADLNGDGWPDVIGYSGAVLLSDRAGHFVGPQSLDQPVVAIATGPHHAPQLIKTPWTTPPELTAVEAGAGGWLPVWTQALSGALATVVAGDYDGDGTSDLFAANESALTVILAAVDGASVSTTVVPLAGGANGLATGDLNGDGLSDVAVVTGDGKQLDVLLSTGWLAFVRQSLWASESMWRPIIADLDLDGRVDLIALDWNLGQWLVFLNGPSGLSAPVAYTLGSGASSWDAAAGDVDGDGDVDLVTVGGSRIMLLRNDGAGHFGTAEPVAPSADPAAVTMGYHVAMADLDGDGDLDLVQTGFIRGQGIFLNDGLGGFEYAGRFGAYYLGDLAVEDLDGDLRPDIVSSSIILYNRCLP
ncbi:MAG: FG-GAP-like repeat-containing protein [Myxococcales bacterium]